MGALLLPVLVIGAALYVSAMRRKIDGLVKGQIAMSKELQSLVDEVEVIKKIKN